MNRLEELLTELIAATPEPPAPEADPQDVIAMGAQSVAKRASLLDQVAALKDVHRLFTSEARELRLRLAELDERWTQALHAAKLTLKQRRRALAQIRRARSLDAL